MSDDHGLASLLALRENVLRDMAEADLEFSRVRMQVERLESDVRIGREPTAEYEDLKGHALPQAEGAVLDLFRQLMKLEDRINTLPR